MTFFKTFSPAPCLAAIGQLPSGRVHVGTAGGVQRMGGGGCFKEDNVVCVCLCLCLDVGVYRHRRGCCCCCCRRDTQSVTHSLTATFHAIASMQPRAGCTWRLRLSFLPHTHCPLACFSATLMKKRHKKYKIKNESKTESRKKGVGKEGD